MNIGGEQEKIRKAGVGGILRSTLDIPRAEQAGAMANFIRGQSAGLPASFQEALGGKIALEKAKKAKTPLEQAKVFSEIIKNRSAGLLDDANKNRVNALLPLQEEAAELGNEELQASIDEYLSLSLQGEEFSIRGREVLDFISKQMGDSLPMQKFNNLLRTQEEDRQTQAANTEKFIIENQQAGGTTPQAGAYQDRFNSSSSAPYVYLKERTGIFGGGEKLTKTPLPTIPLPDGTTYQMTARDANAQAKKLGIPIEQYLELLKKGVGR